MRTVNKLQFLSFIFAEGCKGVWDVLQSGLKRI